MENHGGVSNQPEAILRIVQEVNSPNLGTCPDFGISLPKKGTIAYKDLFLTLFWFRRRLTSLISGGRKKLKI